MDIQAPAPVQEHGTELIDRVGTRLFGREDWHKPQQSQIKGDTLQHGAEPSAKPSIQAVFEPQQLHESGLSGEQQAFRALLTGSIPEGIHYIELGNLSQRWISDSEMPSLKYEHFHGTSIQGRPALLNNEWLVVLNGPRVADSSMKHLAKYFPDYANPTPASTTKLNKDWPVPLNVHPSPLPTVRIDASSLNLKNMRIGGKLVQPRLLGKEHLIK